MKTSTEISMSFQSSVCCSNQIIACISVSRCIILSVFDWNFESVQCNRQNRSPLLALDWLLASTAGLMPNALAGFTYAQSTTCLPGRHVHQRLLRLKPATRLWAWRSADLVSCLTFRWPGLLFI